MYTLMCMYILVYMYIVVCMYVCLYRYLKPCRPEARCPLVVPRSPLTSGLCQMLDTRPHYITHRHMYSPDNRLTKHRCRLALRDKFETHRKTDTV